MERLLTLPVLRTLANVRFLRALVWIAFVPSLLGFWTMTLFLRLWKPESNIRDLFGYLDAAALISHGKSPYAHFQFVQPDPVLAAGYTYPPLLAWLLQPLASLDWTIAERLFIVLDHVGLAAAVVLSCLALGRLRAWAVMLSGLLTIFYYPVLINLYDKQITPILLGLTAIWLVAFARGDEPWGGAALGLSIAVKMFQGPQLTLLVAFRQWRQLAAALLVAGALTLVAVPANLWELYWRILRPLSGGSGYVENQAPAWMFARLLHPASVFGQPGPAPLDAKLVVYAFAALALVITYMKVGKLAGARYSRAVQGAAILACVPLTWPYAYPQHLILLLPSMIILLVSGIDRRDVISIAAAVAGWLLISPIHTEFVNSIAWGMRSEWWLLIGSTLSPIGTTLTWLGCLRAAERERKADV